LTVKKCDILEACFEIACRAQARHRFRRCAERTHTERRSIHHGKEESQEEGKEGYQEEEIVQEEDIPAKTGMFF
jgi:hypothetical protein